MQEQTENPTNSASTNSSSVSLLSEAASAPAADGGEPTAAGVPENRRAGRPRVFRNGAERQKAYRGRVTKKASTRIRELVAEVKKLREESEQRLAAERAASIAAYERRLLAFRALNQLAEATAIRTRHPDYNAVVEAAEKLVPTWMIEEILCVPTARLHAAELFFLLCSNVELVKKLQEVPLQQAIRFLIKFDESFQLALAQEAARPFLDVANSLSEEDFESEEE